MYAALPVTENSIIMIESNDKTRTAGVLDFGALSRKVNSERTSK